MELREELFVRAAGEIERDAAKSHHTNGRDVTVNGWRYWVMACYSKPCDQVYDDGERRA